MRPILALPIFFLPLAILLDGAGRDVPSPTALLDQYAHGDFTAVTGSLANLSDFKALLDGLKVDGPAWIAVGAPADETRRRLVAATVALEAARADEWREWKSIFLPQAGEGSRSFYVLSWRPPPLLLQWGADLFRGAGPPTPIERVWQLAAIAVAERGEDFEFLIGSPVAARGNPNDEISYLPGLVKRFPTESRFVLAQGIALGWSRGPATNPAMQVFESLANDEAVGAESMVRLGELRLRIGDPAGARKLFARADADTRDPYVAYLAKFLTGQAFEREHHVGEAVEAYQHALAAIPHAQSASLALASLLFLRDEQTEAAAVLDANLSSRPQPSDPWRVFEDADDRFWPELITRLRAEIEK